MNNRFAFGKPAVTFLALLGLASIGLASIERLTLKQMVDRVDNAVVGRIVDRTATAVPITDGGEELYFTTLTIEGESLLDGKAMTVQVSYPGGFVDEERGVYNSEAPSADETRIGNLVVAFYKWSPNMGGGFASNALYASHGGLFRSFVSKKGQTIVQGRGKGYAVSDNRTLTDLETASRDLYKKRMKKKR